MRRRGCVGGLLGGAIILAVCACILGIAGTIFWGLRSSEVYQMALLEAQNHPEAILRLGEPIEDGWMMSGSINTTNDSGNASFDIPVSGPRGSGTLEVEAVRSGGVWEITQLTLATNQERISLLGVGR